MQNGQLAIINEKQKENFFPSWFFHNANCSSIIAHCSLIF